MATIKGLTLEIGGEVGPLNKALAGVNKTSRDLKSELRQVERLLKLDPKNTELLSQRQKVLAETVENTKDKLDKLKEAEKDAQKQFKEGKISEDQYRALQREVIKTEQDLEKFEERLKKTNPRLEEFGAKAKESGEKLKDVGGKLSKNVTAPLAAAGAGLVAVGVKFDDVFDNIRIGTGATGEELESLNEDFRQIAKDVPASLDDVGTAVADYNTRLGIAGEGLQDLSKQTLELARITGSDLSATIEETSQAFQAFNVPADDYGQSLDFIFKVSQSTGIEINRLQSNMVKFSPALKTLGFDFKQSATLMGQLDKAGVDVEQTLAGLTRAMGSLAKQGVTDANEAISILFNRIKDAPNDMAGAQEAMEIFGARAGPALAKSIREGKLEYQDLLNELQGSDETILGVANETKDFGERFVELKNKVMLTLEPLGEQLFDAINDLVPLIEKAADFVGNLIEKFSNLSPTTQKTILIILALVAALGPLLSLIGAITAALPALKLMFQAMTGHIGLTIAAIAALIAITALIIKNWEPLKGFFKDIWNNIKNTFANVGEWFGNKFDEGWQAIKRVFAGVGDFFSGVWDTIKRVFVDVGVAIGDAVSGSFKAAINGVLTLVDNTINGFINSLNKVVGLINKIPGVNLGTVPKINIPKLETGLQYVPYDNYLAHLHRGERVLTKEENEQLRRSGNLGGGYSPTFNIYSKVMTPAELMEAARTQYKIDKLRGLA